MATDVRRIAWCGFEHTIGLLILFALMDCILRLDLL